MKKLFYRIRLALLMYGFAWVLRVAGIINREFSARLAETDFSFIMGSKEDATARYFRCAGGRLRSSRRPLPKEFGLIWKDNRSGGRAMMDMLFGRPKALYHAVVNGVLLLEGDARSIAWFMETANRLNRVFRPKKEKKGADSGKKN
ncbi:MAG: hypothetical protein ACOZBW_06980 [Thermodesulfobacteriota bacterium]